MEFLKQVKKHRLWIVGFLFCILGSSSDATDEKPVRPNIVMIFSDDQRHDAVGYAGCRQVATPNLDRMARGGLVFNQCFVNTSICAVSRANILSGQYPGRHGIDDFFKHFSPEQLRQSVPGRLQRAGYQTAFFGKWGIGDSPEATHEGAAVFDYWAGQPMQTCYFHEPGCRYVNYDGFSGTLDDLCDCPPDARGKKGYRNRIGKANLKNPLHVDSQVIPLQVKRFLAGRDPEKPFCMMLFFKSPHSPYADWDPAVANAGTADPVALPPGATVENALKEPEIVRTSLGAPTGMRYLTDSAFFQKELKDYYRSVSSLDLGVGRVLDLLKEGGLDKNTVVLFTSDNGHFKGEHGLAGKWLMYEPSLRVPGFIYDPRSKPERPESNRMVITTDFSVTLLALAGLEKPAAMTGRNLMTLFQGSEGSWRKDFLYEHPYGHGGKIPRTIGVRGERYSYTRYIDLDPPLEQLFDIKSDPGQLTNLAALPEYRELLESMAKRCDELEAAQRAGRKAVALPTYTWNFNENLDATPTESPEGISVSALAPTVGGMDCSGRHGPSRATVGGGALLLDRNGEGSGNEWGFRPPFAADRMFFSFAVVNRGNSVFRIDSVGGKSANTGGLLALRLYDASGNDLSGSVNLAGESRVRLKTPATLAPGESKTFYIDFNSSNVKSRHRIDFIRIFGRGNP